MKKVIVLSSNNVVVPSKEARRHCKKKLNWQVNEGFLQKYTPFGRGMVQAWVGQKLVNMTFYMFIGCPIYKYLR